MSANLTVPEAAPAIDDGAPRTALPVPPAATPLPPETDLPDDRYLNRELSWLDFNERVLALAKDPSQPLLERAKFLAIFASNLDEFYMVRVAGLKRRDEAGLSVRSADGLTMRSDWRPSPFQTDVLERLRDDIRKRGLALCPRSRPAEAAELRHAS